MKKLIFLLLVGFGILLIPACSQNSSTNNSTTAITILVDNTEKVVDNSRMKLLPNQSIIDAIGMGKGTVKFQPVNRVSINTSATASIEYSEDIVDLSINDLQDEFNIRLDTLKKEFLGPTDETKSTSLWKTVCDNLKELNESTADKKVLIIMSDMIEFSGNGDFYRSGVKDIKKIKQRMLDSCGVNVLPQNNGVHIIIIYNPNGDPAKERMFNKAYATWEPFWEESGYTYEQRSKF